VTLIARQLAHADTRRERFIAICSAFPETTIDVAREHIAIRIRKKIYAYYVFDHHDDGKIAIWCKSTMSDQQQLIRDDPEVFFKPPYVGPRGWVAMRLDTPDVEWNTVRELVLRAYQESAPRKLAALAK
jgi:phosphoribosylglycinamide formyltransferase-1